MGCELELDISDKGKHNEIIHSVTFKCPWNDIYSKWEYIRMKLIEQMKTYDIKMININQTYRFECGINAGSIVHRRMDFTSNDISSSWIDSIRILIQWKFVIEFWIIAWHSYIEKHCIRFYRNDIDNGAQKKIL